MTIGTVNIVTRIMRMRTAVICEALNPKLWKFVKPRFLKGNCCFRVPSGVPSLAEGTLRNFRVPRLGLEV